MVHNTGIPPRIHFLLAIIGLAGVIIILLATSRFGAGLSPDSIGYIAAARNLAAGKGYLWYNGEPLASWPPLYPSILAIVDYFFGIDPLSSAHVINASVFGLIVYLTGLLIFRYVVPFPAFLILGTTFVLISKPLLSIAVMTWSEPLFILFVLLFLLSVKSYLDNEDIISFVVLSVSAALACLTRYIGVTIIISGIAIFLLLGKRGIWDRLKLSLLFGAISGLPLILWFVRNCAVSGIPTGYRDPSNTALYQNVLITLYRILTWFLPSKFAVSSYSILYFFTLNFKPLLIVTVLSLIACSLVILYHSKLKTLLLGLTPVFIVTVIYIIFLIISSTIVHIDKIDNRLLSPVFIPLVLVVLSGLSTLVQLSKLLLKRFSTKRIHSFMAIIFCMVLLVLFTGTVENIQFLRAQGCGGYNSKKWRESKTVHYLRHQPLQNEYPIYSNDPYALYIFTGFIARFSPLIKTDLSSLRGNWPDLTPAYFIWFDENHSNHYYTPHNLQSITNFSLVFELGDGAIYVVNGKK